MGFFRFRWVFCQLETLRRCFPPSIRRTLNDLPTTLDETYERTLLEIPEERWKHAHHLFQCLITSSRPLCVEELAEILVIRFDSETMPDLISGWRPENSEDAVLSVCSSLIVVIKVNNSPVVQFSHFSVKEFLTSDRLAKSKLASRYHIPLEPAHKRLAQACLSTLLKLDERIVKNGLKNYPLAFYAAQHWLDHARFGDVQLSIQDGIGKLINPDKPHFSAWIWIHDVYGDWRKRSLKGLTGHPSQPKGTPLYYSAACGLRSLTEQLISIYPNDVNPPESSVWVPLDGAVHNGHLDVTRTLLEHGAEVNNKRYDWTPLHYASHVGSSDIVQLLLEYQADVGSRDDFGQTPLHLASGTGQLTAMRLLLEYGADVDSVMHFGLTPLHRASSKKNPEAVRLLLRRGANVDAVDEDGCTALHLEGNIEVALALLEGGANVHVRDKSSRTPFQRASQAGHHRFVQLLLEHGAEAE